LEIHRIAEAEIPKALETGYLVRGWREVILCKIASEVMAGPGAREIWRL
jgi:hypothetical protein